MRAWVSLIILVVLAAVAAVLSGRGPAARADPDHSGPPEPQSPALSAEDARSTFRLAEPGLAIELVAAEPVIEAPVYLAFDEEARLWVCEMRTYMPDTEGAGELEPANRIVVLEDADGDGVYEKSTVFLDGLVLPRGVAPCYQKDGHLAALVLEPPNLLFCRDTDGDGRADEKTRLLDGFAGRDNPEHAGNSLVYGLDNWWHLSQHNFEFRFDGEKVETRSTPNHGQWGLTRDDEGRLYYTPNSNPLLMDVFPKHYAARNPNQGGVAGMGESAAQDATVWPAHATPGVNRGYQENVLRKDGTLASMTAACGPGIYRAGWLGEDFRGDVFICEAAGNLVKRMKLEEKDGRVAGRNVYEGREFLASTDERFRPVHALTGPDGGLYIADMYRGIIQHKTYLTAYLKKQIEERGLARPLEMGRVWRVVPKGAARPAPARLSKASDEELVGLLSHADGWWRDTAQRLLVERRAVGAAPRLRELARSAGPAIPRLHALWTLEGLGAIEDADVLAAMGDGEAVIRIAGLRLAEPHPTADIVEQARMLTDSPNAAVRVQAVLSLGGWRALKGLDPRAENALSDTLRRFGRDRYIRAASITGLRGYELATLVYLLDDPAWPPSPQDAAVFNDLVDAVIRASDYGRLPIAALAGRLAGAGDSRFRAIASRIRRAQQLDSENPRPIFLEKEPPGWAELIARGDDVSRVLAPIYTYFDWPGRPPVERKKEARPLNDAERDLFERGRWLFKDCAACHQENGQGSPGLAPALAGSKIATGPAGRFARAIMHGLEGEYEFSGVKYQGAMPATQLGSDPDLAAVMTYVRRSFGNNAEPVTPGFIAEVRAATKHQRKAWTRAELERIRK
ncbi:MAG: c-type cytochrome [Phycisphaerales bacterium]|nr:c-type cytochrome [Phycisphaerales bacterium]